MDTCKGSDCEDGFGGTFVALGSVPRSVANPFTTNDVNIGDFLNVLVACRDESKCKRTFFAASPAAKGIARNSPRSKDMRENS